MHVALRLAGATVGLDEDGRSVVFSKALRSQTSAVTPTPTSRPSGLGTTWPLRARPGAKVGLSGLELGALRRAGVVHGWGRLGVSNAIWDKRGTLRAGEWERVRMHPYFHRAHAVSIGGVGATGGDRRGIRERLDAGRATPAHCGHGGQSACRLVCLVRPTPTHGIRAPAPSRNVLRPRAATAELPGGGEGWADTRRDDDEAIPRRLAIVSPAGEGPAGLAAREVDVLRLVLPGLVEQGGQRRDWWCRPEKTAGTTSSASTPRSASPTEPAPASAIGGQETGASMSAGSQRWARAVEREHVGPARART